MTTSKWARAAACAVLAAVCGCDRGAPTLAEIEARERSSRMYTNAMDDLQAGRMDAAIRGFERVVLDEPKSYSAHFQLATLLQDVRKDYVGAIAHYRAYLALRPASDKATVAEDRVKLCDTLLAAEYVRKAGGSATDKLAGENERLAAERDRLAAQVRTLTAALAATNRTVARLTNESALHKRMLAKIRDEDDGKAAPGKFKTATAKAALDELRAMEQEERRRRLRPTDAELLDEDDGGDRLLNSPDVKKLLAEAKNEAAADTNDPRGKKPAAPAAGAADGKKASGLDVLLSQNTAKKKGAAAARPETYTVQAGDTLFKISSRFYGSNAMWRKIREANKAIIPPDGRVRAGQVLTLP